MHVVVAGGGITGLTAAFRLLSAGASARVTLLEAGERLGGSLLTVHKQGFLFEGGPDAFVAQKPQAKKLCVDLGLSDRLQGTRPESRHVYFLRHGRLSKLPEGMVLAVPTRFLPLAKSPIFSLLGVARMGLDLVIPRRASAEDESIASFLSRRLGREAVDVLGEPLLGGIYSGDPARLSIRATFPQLLELERQHGSLVKGAIAMRQRAPKPGAGAAPSAFLALRGGMGELIETLAARVTELGGQIQRGVALQSVSPAGSGYKLALTNGGEVTCDRLLLALPAQPAARLLAPLSEQAAQIARAIPHVSTATCLLAYERSAIDHPMDAAGVLIPKSEGYDASALTFMSSKWEGRAPEGKALLRVFFGGQAHPEVRQQSDDDLRRMAEDTLRRVIGLRAPPLFSEVFRWNDCRPQPVVGHLERLATLRRALEAFPGLLVAGGAFDGVGIPDCVRQAEEAAQRLLSPL